MGKRLAGVVAAGIAVALGGVNPSAAGAAPDVDDRAAAAERQLAAGIQVAPKQPPGAHRPRGANPYLSFGTDPATIDYAAWNRAATDRAATRTEQPGAQAQVPPRPVKHPEREPRGSRGHNDTLATAELIQNFGSRPTQANRALVHGALSPEEPALEVLPQAAEDNGSIRLAVDTGISASRRAVTVDGAIGDGPHGMAGSARGDYDFYTVTGEAGHELLIDVDTPTGDLDSIVGVYDSSGRPLAFNDNESSTSADSLLEFQLPTDGTYHVLLGGHGRTALPADPFDSGSGAGAGSEGPYRANISMIEVDLDAFAVVMQPGDVFGAAVGGGAARLRIYDPVGKLVMGSARPEPGAYLPESSPLPAKGNAVANHVATVAGRHTVVVSQGSGEWEATFGVYRPRPEQLPSGTVQTLFVDFDGADVDAAIFKGEDVTGVRALSPFASFLSGWGLTAAEESTVIDAVIRNVEAELARVRSAGANRNMAFRVLNSRDHGEQWSQANVTRVVVGGTTTELGIPTVGIAQSIDPGNFEPAETAVVLLDWLSGPTTGPVGHISLNAYLRPQSDKIGFIARVLASLVLHEAGHLYGGYHTDRLNAVPEIMDQGGRPVTYFGIGPDGLGGTPDDITMRFGQDVYAPIEGLAGTEDPLNRVAFALSVGKRNDP